jgi:magnesium chelatase subunit D
LDFRLKNFRLAISIRYVAAFTSPGSIACGSTVTTAALKMIRTIHSLCAESESKIENSSIENRKSMYFPFSAYLGYSVARRALLCTLVDPTLRGVILSGPVGTGKTSIVRSFGAFVRAHVDPEAPFVEVPLGVSDDRLIGGIDLDASLASGERYPRSGLVAGADGGFLFVDDLPLLDGLSATTIMHALEAGTITIEREGMSRVEPTGFVLLATTVPTERDLEISLADRVAFLIAEERRISTDSVHLLIGRLDRYAASPGEFYHEYDAAERKLASQVATARLLHPLIRMEEEAMWGLAVAASKLNVTGNRADVLAAKAARAHAALRGSRTVEEEDLKFAVATVLKPRAENVPDDSMQSEEEKPGEERGGKREESEDQRDGESAGANDDREESGEEGASEGASGEKESDRSVQPEELLDALDFAGPLVDLADFFRSGRSNVSGSRGNMPQWRRGRHTRSLQIDPQGRRIAIGATLRAASAHQKKRRQEGESRVIVRGEDIRVKKFTERAGTLFIFCVDASGSMAMNRMREAKGAVTRLLQDAYINRDSVALIACRGSEAEVLLPPTSSVERAKRSLDILPTGGGTPLASALLKAYAMVAQERRRGAEQTLVVLLTDGRANVPMAESAAGMIMEIRRRHVRRELETLAAAYRRDGVRALVIDTKQAFGAKSEAVRLAEMLGGEYYYLPQIDARGIAGVVREVVGGR